MFCGNTSCPDFLETGFHAEFVDGVTVCPRCGEYLVSSVPELHETAAASDCSDIGCSVGSCSDPLEPAFETDDPSEIAAVEDVLRASGIPFETRVGERAEPNRRSRFLKVRPIEEPVLFLVPKSMASRAWDLLAEFDDEG